MAVWSGEGCDVLKLKINDNCINSCIEISNVKYLSNH